MGELKMGVADLERFLAEVFPQALQAGFRIAEVTDAGVTLTLQAGHRHLRPGGTVMGPTLMMLADTVTYLTILSRMGPVALAVTTSLEIHFLKKAGPGEIEVRGVPLKIGRRIAVVNAELWAGEERVAFATVTYAIPDRRG